MKIFVAIVKWRQTVEQIKEYKLRNSTLLQGPFIYRGWIHAIIANNFSTQFQFSHLSKIRYVSLFKPWKITHIITFKNVDILLSNAAVKKLFGYVFHYGLNKMHYPISIKNINANGIDFPTKDWPGKIFSTIYLGWNKCRMCITAIILRSQFSICSY